MVVRVSNGLFLEILESEAVSGVPIEVDVYDGDNLSTMLATLEGATNVGWTDPLNDIGSGKLRLPVADPKATGTIVRSGNLIKMKLGGIYRYAFWVENPKVNVAAVSGIAGKFWAIGGRGSEAYLERAIVYPPGYPVVTGTERVFTNQTFGAILKTLIDEAQARGAIPALTYDFGSILDSQGNVWPQNVSLTIRAGASLLDVWKQMTALGMDSRMTTNLKLQGFVEFARHKEDEVIFREGKHLDGEVTKELQDAALRTRVLTEGADGKYIEVNDPALEAIPRIGRREGFTSFSSSGDPTTLQIVGEAALRVLASESEAISVPVSHGPASAGEFEPYTIYRPGDWVTLNVPGFYDLVSYRLRSITIEQKERDYAVDVDLNSVAVEELVTLHRMIDALGGGSSGASTGGSMSSVTGPSNGGSGGGNGKVGAELGDAPGFLYDKIAAGAGIVKALIGSAGARQVELAASPQGINAATDVDTVSVAPTNGQALVWNAGLGLWVPGTVGGGGGGGASAEGIDADALHGTYGDEFNGVALDAKWTRQTVTAGEETFGRGFIELALSAATVGRGYYQTPGAMFTNGELILGPVTVQELPLAGHMFGPMFVNNAGTGVGFSVYHDGNAYMWVITAWVYAGTGTSIGGYGGASFRRGERHWMKLRKAGTSYFGAVSYGGVLWSPETAAQVNATVMTRIGFGRMFSNSAGYKAAAGRFNVANVS